jgi:hypothetical protein
MAKRWPPKRWTPHNLPTNYQDDVRALVLATLDWPASDRDRAIAFADKVAAEGMRLGILSLPPDAPREMRNVFWGNLGFRRLHKDHFGHLPKPLGRPPGTFKDDSKLKDRKSAVRQRRGRARQK